MFGLNQRYKRKLPSSSTRLYRDYVGKNSKKICEERNKKGTSGKSTIYCHCVKNAKVKEKLEIKTFNLQYFASQYH